jgi:hypothetical protein
MLAGGVALALCLQTHAVAATFTETGDAGQTLPTSQAVTIPDPTAIAGGIADPTDADLYAIFLSAGTTFSATVTSGGGTGDLLDSQLFLFDASGAGLVFNDDTTSIDFLSSLVYTPGTSGVYYLGISAVGFDPQDASGFIFPNTSTGQVGPNPGAGTLTGWAEDGTGNFDQGAYTIQLSGAQAVPEPATTVGLLALGLGGALLRRRTHSRP